MSNARCKTQHCAQNCNCQKIGGFQRASVRCSMSVAMCQRLVAMKQYASCIQLPLARYERLLLLLLPDQNAMHAILCFAYACSSQMYKCDEHDGQSGCRGICSHISTHRWSVMLCSGVSMQAPDQRVMLCVCLYINCIVARLLAIAHIAVLNIASKYQKTQ